MPLPRSKDTPGSLMVLNHYRETGVIYGWDNVRVERLCRYLNISLHELGRLCGAFHTPKVGEMPNHGLVQRCQAENHWPPYLALHFALLESWYLSEVLPRRPDAPPPKPVIPIDCLISQQRKDPHRD